MKGDNVQCTTPLLVGEEENISGNETLNSKKIEGTGKQRDDNGDKVKKNLRWTVIYIMYYTMFVQVVSYSFMFGSVWQYLKSMNGDITEVFLGWTITSRSVVGVMANFLFGFWCDRRSWIEPLFVSIVLFLVGNVLYIFAESFGRAGIWIVLISQQPLGFSQGVFTISRALVAHYSYPEEISKTFASLGFFQTIGFAIGPSVQAIGYFFSGNSTLYRNYHIDLFTAPSYFMIVLGLVNFGLYLMLYYKDVGKRKIEPLEMEKGLPESGTTVDRMAVATMLIIFFVVESEIINAEVVYSPMLMEVMGWEKQKSVIYGSLMLIGHAILVIIVYLFISPLSKRIHDKSLLLFGLVVLLVFNWLHCPFGPGKVKLRLPDVRYPNGTIIHSQVGGCPYEYEWCHNAPRLPLPQLLVAFIGSAIPVTLTMSLVNIIYAKIIGQYHKGLFMALFTGIGTICRTVSPLYISYVYKSLGYRWANVYITQGLTLLAIISFLFNWNRILFINKSDN